MTHKDEIWVCPECKFVHSNKKAYCEASHDPNVVLTPYLPASSVKELVEALGDISKIIPERDCYSDIDLFRKAVSMAKAALKQFEED